MRSIALLVTVDQVMATLTFLKALHCIPEVTTHTIRNQMVLTCLMSSFVNIASTEFGGDFKLHDAWNDIILLHTNI